MKIILNSLALLLITVAVSAASDKTVIRVGHFPNITHVQGLVAHNLSRQGKGWFEARLGPSVEIQWFTYNAGPSAMEAIFAKSIELTYVGPGPALNACRFQREKNRNAAARQHPGHFVPSVAHVGWLKNYAARRRRAGAADAKPRSAFAFSAEENRRRMDG